MDTGVANGIYTPQTIGLSNGVRNGNVLGLSNGILNESNRRWQNIQSGIVKDNLTLHVDGYSKYSYSGSGAQWNDMSPYAYHSSLINGPTYDYLTGAFTFNGSNSYANTLLNLVWNNTNSVSIMMWLKTGNTSQSRGFVGQSTYMWQFRQGAYSTVNSDLTFIYWDDGGGHSNGDPLTMSGFFDNTGWRHLAMTWNHTNSLITFYKNASSFYSYTYTNPSLNRITTSKINIGGNVYSWDGNGSYWNGSIGSLTIYRRAVSASEITQNYNATKQRFGL